MSSQESREARQKRLARQAQGSRDALRQKSRTHRPADPAPGPSLAELAADPWSDEYTGQDPHDEDYFTENELNFEDGA